MYKHTNYIFRLQDIVKVYGNREVLRLPHMTIERGEVFCIVGPSGAGKSTLLRLLNFIESPTEGYIDFERYQVNGAGPPPLDLRRRITMVFQRPVLFNTTVLGNIVYGIRLRGERNGHHRIERIMDELGLGAIAQQPAHSLSGGQQQRVALARAMVVEPDVLLLDEPTAHLDPSSVSIIEEMIQRINRERGTTIVLVTHNVFQAKRLANHVALLLDGEATEVSDAQAFFESPGDPRTAAFVSGQMIY